VIQMSKTRMATRICELEKARMPSPWQNQGTFHYILAQVICFSPILESTWKVYYSLQALQHPENKESGKMCCQIIRAKIVSITGTWYIQSTSLVQQ
jgi:hypothetical protein